MKLVALLLVVVAVSVNGENVSVRAGFPGGDQPCYTTASSGLDGGVCMQKDCCSGSLYISNLCPDYGANIKCCYSSNTCTASCGTCDSTVASLACEILAMQETGKISLKQEHFSAAGNSPADGATAMDNIRDTCYGKQAKRSSYCDADGCAPGGCVCLQSKMLTALRDYATSFWNQYKLPLQVNALAGSSHSPTSYHYTGRTMDVPCTTPVNHCTALVNFCSARSPIEMCYPGGPCSGHDTWVHCAL